MNQSIFTAEGAEDAKQIRRSKKIKSHHGGTEGGENQSSAICSSASSFPPRFKGVGFCFLDDPMSRCSDLLIRAGNRRDRPAARRLCGLLSSKRAAWDLFHS